MTRPLTVALGTHDSVRAIADGTTAPADLLLDVVTLPASEILERMCGDDAFDVGEFSLSDALRAVACGERRHVFLPVFPHRTFRHSMVWVRADSSWSGLGDLRGARVGIGAYATTALLFLRGLLEDEHGIRPADVTWLRTRPERRPLAVSGVVIQDVKTDLDTLLRTRAVDAIAAFESPADAAAPRPGARRLVRDESAVTADYRRRTGIFPIMHVIALRASIHDRDRSIASRLVDAFERARARGDPGSPPYGVSPNRATLDAALRYARRQYALELPGDVADMFIRT